MRLVDGMYRIASASSATGIPASRRRDWGSKTSTVFASLRVTKATLMSGTRATPCVAPAPGVSDTVLALRSLELRAILNGAPDDSLVTKRQKGPYRLASGNRVL